MPRSRSRSTLGVATLGARALESASRRAAEAAAIVEMLHGNSTVGFAFVDRGLRVKRLNPILAALISPGFEPMGHLFIDIVPGLWAQVGPPLSSVLTSGEPITDVPVDFGPASDAAGTGSWLASYYPVRVDQVVIGVGVIVVDRTELVRAEAQRRQLSQAQQIASLGSFEFDPITGAMEWSQELFRVLGIDPELAATPQLLISAVDASSQDSLQVAWSDALESGTSFELVCRTRLPVAARRWVEIRGAPTLGDDRRSMRLTGTVRDNTERVEAERLRNAAERRIEVGFEQGGIGVAVLDLSGIPVRVNQAVCELLGRSQDLLVGRTWAAYNHPDDGPPGPAVDARLATGTDSYSDERRYVQPDGAVVWASTHLTLVRDDDGQPDYFLVQLQDITARKRMERELSHQAMHDALTDLPNRALLADRLHLGLAGSRARGSQLGVIFLDVDHFKVVNDSLGHSTGDVLLRLVAARISAAIRPGDTVARFGGDEFVIVCDDVSASETGEIAARILQVLGESFAIDGHAMDVTASVGIAIADGSATPESLLRDSDTAMYRAKQRGRGCIEVFDEELRAKAERRRTTSSSLGRALARCELEVYYQPVFDVATRAMVSSEALLRWRHPQRGFVSPAEFIPLAEETGLIVEIGAWVLEQACTQIVVWRRTLPAMTVAVNLSVRQMIAPDITDVVAGALRRTGADAGSLCLELTESIFMEDVEYFAHTMANLRAMGVRLAIDDFGTGYSSLSYLQRFPVDVVKIDRAFVETLANDPHGVSLVGAIIAMAAALDLEVVAEGIETREQLSALHRLKCERAQGFLLGKPMPALELTALMASPFASS